MSEPKFSEADVHAIAAAVALQLVDNQLTVDPERHANDHRFISEFIEERRAARDRYEHFKRSVGGWLLITCLGGVGYAIWSTFVRELHK